MTMNLAVKEESLEESSCNQIIHDSHENDSGEGINVKNETVERINIIEQKEPLRASPYGPWVPVEKVTENSKVSVYCYEIFAYKTLKTFLFQKIIVHILIS